ncbi:MAG TPA: cobalt ECF transporter T component CbiQ [Chloroflexia bacterium]|nr:cobalt ECF transporter T component CbiQ [Chloroflexia bacterium]
MTETTTTAGVKKSAKGKESIGWLEKTVAGITATIEHSVFREEIAQKPGRLQGVDPRAKLGMFLVVILAASLTSSLPVLVALYALLLLAARASQVPFDFFVKRVWVGIPFFAGIVVIPSIFFVPGAKLFSITLGSMVIGPSIPGLTGAVLFVARVGVSVSVAVLLVIVTSWSDLLKSLQAVKVPQIFILLLSMTYRYIFLFLRTSNGLFEARKSRVVGRTSGNEQRNWISGSMGGLMNRSFKMSNDVYAAMLARGFNGHVRTYNSFKMRQNDWLALAATTFIAIVALVAGRFIG